MKIKYFTLIFLLLILFLFYGCGEKRAEDVKTTSYNSIDTDVNEVDSSINEIEDAELNQIDADLEYIENI